MNKKISEIADRIAELEQQLERALTDGVMRTFCTATCAECRKPKRSSAPDSARFTADRNACRMIHRRSSVASTIHCLAVATSKAG